MMEKTHKILMAEFCATIVLALILVILFENDILLSGGLADAKSHEFVFATIMELLTICFIPLSLRLFKFKSIHAKLSSDDGNAAHRMAVWGTIRMMMICIPLLVNTLLYYLFMNVAFGYMAIILLLCMFFIFPSKQRCMDESK